MSRGYIFEMGCFPNTGKPPASVFYDPFLDKSGTLSFLGGICKTPYLNSIEFTA